jgi:hypothetical protein
MSNYQIPIVFSIAERAKRWRETETERRPYTPGKVGTYIPQVRNIWKATILPTKRKERKRGKKKKTSIARAAILSMQNQE